MYKKILAFVAFFCVSSFAMAQVATSSSAEMADRMRADGKIYVVVAIILVILAGFITYLALLDRKIGKLEEFVGKKRR